MTYVSAILTPNLRVSTGVFWVLPAASGKNSEDDDFLTGTVELAYVVGVRGG